MQPIIGTFSLPIGDILEENYKNQADEISQSDYIIEALRNSLQGKYEEAKRDLTIPVGQEMVEKVADEEQKAISKGISYSGLKKKLNIKDKNYLQEAIGVNQRVNF